MTPARSICFAAKDEGIRGSEVIKDKSGRPMLKVPDQKDEVESFGSWPAVVDWDDDGDLDIIVGTYSTA